MPKKPYRYTVLTLLAFLPVAGALAAQWDGHYVYEASYGKSVGGSYIGEQYEITINHGGAPDCLIAISGFQRDERIGCTVKIQGRKAILLFSNSSVIQPSSYSVGAPLLALEFRPKGKIQTTWLRLQTLDDKHKKPGFYFTKVKSSGA